MNAPFQLNETEVEVPYKLFYDVGSIVVPNHWHKEIEIAYSVQGGMRLTINNNMCELKEGDVAIINSGDVHFYFQTENHRRLVIIFDPAMFDYHGSGELYSQKVQKRLSGRVLTSNGWGEEQKKKITGILDRLAEINESTMWGRDLAIRAYVYELIVILCNEVPKYSETEAASTDISSTMKMLSNLEKVFDYVENNYQNPISLKDAADEVGFTTSYFARFFKRFTNMTFLNYLNAFRVGKAQEKLANSNKNITQIAESVGFPNVKTFNRIFKENVHISPTKYRKSIFEKNE